MKYKELLLIRGTSLVSFLELMFSQPFRTEWSCVAVNSKTASEEAPGVRIYCRR